MPSLKRATKCYFIGGLLALAFTIFLAGCSTSSTPAPIPTTERTLVLEPATPSPIPTTQPTLVTEPATPSPIPTDTPTPTPSPIPTPTPTPEPDGVVIYKSGIMGTTSFFMSGGAYPGRLTGGPGGPFEFAIAPMEGDSPAYDKALFVTAIRRKSMRLSFLQENIG